MISIVIAPHRRGDGTPGWAAVNGNDVETTEYAGQVLRQWVDSGCEEDLHLALTDGKYTEVILTKKSVEDYVVH
jgi:hypothetical protein